MLNNGVCENENLLVQFEGRQHYDCITFSVLWNFLSNSNVKIDIYDEQEIMYVDNQFKIISHDIQRDLLCVNDFDYITRTHIDDNITKLIFTNDTSLNLTNNHSLGEYDKGINKFRINTLDNCSYVPIMCKRDSFTETIDYEYLLLGLWFGDGTYSGRSSFYPALSLYNSQEFIELFDSQLKDFIIYPKGKPTDFYVNYKPLKAILDKHNLVRVHSPDRAIPMNLFNELVSDVQKSDSFIIGYWLADGTYSTGQFSFSSACEMLLAQIKHLLMIRGNYSHVKIDRNGREYKGKLKGDMYVLSMLGLNWNIFNIFDGFKHFKNCKPFVFKGTFFGDGTKGNVCRILKRRYLFDVRALKIMKRETVDYKGFVYDLKSSTTNNFIVNGIIIHDNMIKM